jgi:FkbM family methyltransferase
MLQFAAWVELLLPLYMKTTSGNINTALRALRSRWRRLTGQQHSAITVSQQAALAWFEKKRPSYDRLVTAIAPYIQDTGTIFDVGANIGYFSSLLVQKTKFHGRIILFEPLPHLAELCKTTLESAPCITTVLNMGLSDVAGKADIRVASDGNLGWNTLVQEKASTDMQSVSVSLKPFAECGVDDVPHFIKIDVEGFEYKVLRGMMWHLKHWNPQPVILCEVGWGTSHPSWKEECAVFQELEHSGYRITDLNGHAINVTTLSRTTDILLLPRVHF